MLVALWLSSRQIAKQSWWPQEKSIQDFSSNSKNSLRHCDNHLGLQKGCLGLEKAQRSRAHVILAKDFPRFGFQNLHGGSRPPIIQSQGIWHPRLHVATIYTCSQNTNRHKIKVILKKDVHESLRAPIFQGREKRAQKGRKCHNQANRTQQRNVADFIQAWILGLWNETSPWERLPTASNPSPQEE